MIDPGLDKKVVLGNGANHGIGAATARLFAAHGSRVFVACYRKPGKHAANELADARRAGIGARCFTRPCTSYRRISSCRRFNVKAGRPRSSRQILRTPPTSRGSLTHVKWNSAGGYPGE